MSAAAWRVYIEAHEWQCEPANDAARAAAEQGQYPDADTPLVAASASSSVTFDLSRISNGAVIPEPRPTPDAIEDGPKFEGTNWAIEIPDLAALIELAGREGAIIVSAPSTGRPAIEILDDHL